MSCWTAGLKTIQVGQAMTGAPGHGTVPQAAPNKCALCGWFATRFGTCVNPNCGERAAALAAAGSLQQPSPHGADWTARPSVLGQALSWSAWAYLKSVGLPRAHVEAALQTKKAEVWMYLLRCPHCKAFVRRDTGVCNNPRCRWGRARAQVVAPEGPWSWPPGALSLSHLERALSDAGGMPDAHAAWHQRASEVALQAPDPTAPLEERLYYMEVLEQVCHTGFCAGWLDPQHPARDLHALRALETASADVLPAAAWPDGGDIRAYEVQAVLRGDWPLLALRHLKRVGPNQYAYAKQPQTPCEMIDPVVPPAERGAARAFLTMLFHATSSPWAEYVGQHIADVVAATLDSGQIPALPPERSEIPEDIAEAACASLRQRHTWLWASAEASGCTNGLPAAQEAYLWLAAARLDPQRRLTSEQRQRAVSALKDAGEALGYRILDDSAAAEVINMAWSPAQARRALHARVRENGR